MNKLRSCGTCAMADFAKTPTGRFKKGATSRCAYHIQMPVLPAAIRGEVASAPDFLDRHKSYVSPDDGTDCPLHCEKQ